MAAGTDDRRASAGRTAPLPAGSGLGRGGADGLSGWVAGVDGARGGWVCCLFRPGDRAFSITVHAAFCGILGLRERPAVIAVDMPIGLPAMALRGGRACERAARALLPGRASSVFAVPALAALEHDDYAAASAANRASGPGAVGLSRQAFNLFPKLRELEALRGGGHLDGVYETHPELGFARLNGGAPMRHGKRTAVGRGERLALLSRHGLGGLERHLGRGRPAGTKDDDILDAACCALVAAAIGAGAAHRLAGDGEGSGCRGIWTWRGAEPCNPPDAAFPPRCGCF